MRVFASSSGSVSARSSHAAREHIVLRTFARRCSTPNGWNSKYAISATRAGSGGISRAKGPGAGSPIASVSRRYARRASPPVTFCSRTIGISRSVMSPVCVMRKPRRRRQRSRTTPCGGSNPSTASRAPHQAGARSSIHPAPRPHASTSTPSSDEPNRTVTGPSGVLDARTTSRSDRRMVGSPAPRYSGRNVERRSIGCDVETKRDGIARRLRHRQNAESRRECRLSWVLTISVLRLQIEIQRELVRVRPQPYLIELVQSLVLDPRVDHVLREHAAVEQPLVVGVERVEHFFERTRYLLDRCLLGRRQVVQV